MAGLNLNFGSSVVKREAKPAGRIKSRLENDGWRRTAEVANGRIAYYEKSRVNITVIDGPMGTTILPSGPIRGKIFGDVNLFSRDSVLGFSSRSNRDEDRVESQMKGSNRTGDTTIL